MVIISSDFTDSWVALPWEGFRVWGTFLAIGIGALFALGAYRRESRRDRAREQREIAEQASKITAWVEIRSGAVRVRNASDLPVSIVTFWIGSYSDAPPYRRRRPTQRRRHAEGQDLLFSLNPFHAMNNLLPAKNEQQYEEIPLGNLVEQFGENPRIGMRFTDAHGSAWIRVDGRLFNDGTDDRRGPLRALLRRAPKPQHLPPVVRQSQTANEPDSETDAP